ncbi:hypothetical protein DFH06DRAFT_291582 [Mycena polygramma]|nr:hypothetical protein DFH06DRAFT_291582 [Mycena polygramma]
MARTYDKAHIQALIETKRTKISTLATQIHDLTRLREAEISELAVLQLMLSPTGKLPTELLAHIFLFVIPPEAISEWDEDNVDDIIEGALTVSQVCRHWRRIAHGTPQLWVEGFRLSASQNADLALEQTTAWLERSRPLPITICFRDVANGGVDFVGTGVPGALLSTAGRWKRIVWTIPSLIPLCDLPSSGSLERLERFTIETRNLEMPPREIVLSAPLLRRVRISVCREDGRQGNLLALLRLPWRQLTHILLGDDFTLNECGAIVAQCINVLSITIYACQGWGGVLPTTTIAVLPFLKELEIYVCDEDGPISGIAHFLGRLALPALRVLGLTIEDQPEETIWDVRKFSDFQDRSPSIEKIELKLLRCSINADHLIPLLRHSPALTELVLGRCHIDDAFVRALRVNANDDQVLAPSLMKLDLRDFGDGPSDDALEVMVKSRWCPESLAASQYAAPGIHFTCIQEVVLSRRHSRDGENSISAELRESLGPLQEQGLHLSLR